MDNIQYIGERLWPGQLGHFFVIVSFVAALFSAFSYFRSAGSEHDATVSSKWLLMGRWGFVTHSFSVVAIFVALFYIITRHLFEYHYAWEHSSLDMPSEYLLSCFWEGQQGSFMLWTFWHAILGLIVMRTARGLESRTMAVISVVQVCLTTMILGLYLGEHIKVGSTPFMLLRHAMPEAPFSRMPNYLEMITDGNGLNILLQNYWMVIHPPILFLGFALTLIPFAYCIAALWKGDMQSFIKPTIVWSLAGGAILGLGIMMGGAWAYESLNFGGYWAWDPVENASLVPWLTLVGGLHTLLVYKSTKRAFTITFVLLLLTHLLIWYSTFLTRTGILGKTSVHAFTGDGTALTYHLLIVIGLLLLLSIALMAYRWKAMPRIRTEEEILSREFWMFIGSVILFLASIEIAITTSIPVWAPLAKWITGKDLAPPTDPMSHYNNIQVWVAIIIGLLSATILYMKYKNSDGNVLAKRLGGTGAVALVMAALIAWGQEITTWQYVLMLFAACYGIVSTIWYGAAIQKGRFSKLGASVSHLGFATVLLGILLSSYNKHAISLNTTGMSFDLKKNTQSETIKENMENVIMFRGVPVAMGPYFATYIGDSEVHSKDRRIYYRVVFEKKDTVTKKVSERFTLYPDAFINPKGQQGLSANPSTKHYWDRDVFTYINSATDKSKSDTSSYRSHTVQKPGDSIYLSNGFMIFRGFSNQINDKRYQPAEGDLAVKAQLDVYDLAGLKQTLNPIYILRDKQYIMQVDDTLEAMGLYTRFGALNVHSKDSASVDIQVRQTNPMDDFIVLKALVFPYINVLWLGVVVMVFGFLISMTAAIRAKQVTS
ncbi:cytochrome c biogenesis protein CcsA [Nemorincola caseinilytica]|uniref:Cytochrome c biogenesis protein CcsA n=1 Tax=Nemorincola caseinilytica TaxID=2054315 RepID=A0ABP8N430_9BACT